MILLLRRHRALGYVFTPFLGMLDSSESAVRIDSPLSAADTKTTPLNAEEKQIVETCDKYSDGALFKRFVNRRAARGLTASTFFDEMKPAHYEKVMRPYVDKRLNEVFEIALKAGIPVFFREGNDSAETLSQRIRLREKPLVPEFYFRKMEEGISYRMTLHTEEGLLDVKNAGIIIISNEPLLFLKELQIFKSEQINNKNLKPFLSKEEVFIPSNFTQQYLEGFVKKAVRDFKVRLEGMQLRDEGVGHPQTHLTLTNDLYGKPALELIFTYEGRRVHYRDSKDTLVFLNVSESGIVYRKIRRNPDKEKEIIKMLEDKGLRRYQEHYFRPLDYEGWQHHLIHWMNAHSKELSAYGIEFNGKLDEQNYYLGNVQLNMEVAQSKQDWFDLYMRVWLDETSFPFVNLVQHIRNKNPAYTLDDGRIFIIPDAWFTEYADIIRFATAREEYFEVKKQHVGLLHPPNVKDVDSPFLNNETLLNLYRQTFPEKIAEPEGLHGILREYQKTGLTWLYHLHQSGFGGCLADDMGLGKTIQTLALLLKTSPDATSQPEDSQSQLRLFSAPATNKKPSLLVMPTSLLHNWKNEIEKFAPSLKVLIYGGIRKDLPARFHQYDIILASYGVMRIDVEILQRHSFHYLILDESQYVKNPFSKTYKALLELHSDYRLALTGTPVENSLSDLWAQLHFLNRGLLGSYESFQEQFVTPVEQDKDETREESLKRLIRPFILRRRKKEVVKELPDLTEQVYWCAMTEEQEEAYESYKSGIRNNLLHVFEEGTPQNRIRILEALLRMRQMSNHPKLMNSNFDGTSGKFKEVVRSIHNLISEGHKALLFSSFTGYLDLFAEYLDEQKISYAMLTGKSRDREKQVEQFQTRQDIRLFLISLKAGGTGLNLTASDYVFILDPWWNPAAENQALSRSHRIGQKNKVFVYRFITRNTIEEKIYSLQQKKQKVADTFVNSNNPFKQLSDEELKNLFDFRDEQTPN